MSLQEAIMEAVKIHNIALILDCLSSECMSRRRDCKDGDAAKSLSYEKMANDLWKLRRKAIKFGL